MNDEELENEEDLEEQEESAEQQGPNPERAKDEVKDLIKKEKKAKEAVQKVHKASKNIEKANKVKAAAKLASGTKKFALLANPYFWIALLVILALIVLIGIIMSFSIMPSNFMGKTKKFVENMMQGFCGFLWGDNTSPISNDSEDVKDLANYIQNMGYDIQGYGFGDVEYTDKTKKVQEDVQKSDEKANAIEGKRNYVTEEQATQGGEIKKVFGLQAVTTVSSTQYEDGDEMYRITGRFSSKNNDYLRAYLSAEAATYTEATYSIKGFFNELGGSIIKGLKDIFGGNSAKDWEDPGDVGVKAKSTGMLNFTNMGGNNLFNSTFSGSPDAIRIDPQKRKLMLYENAFSLGNAKFQWGHTFSVDLTNWTAVYGRPLELFLALHLSSMMPDLPYQIAVDQAFNTKVNITLQDIIVNIKTKVKIDNHEVEIFATKVNEVDGGIQLTDVDGQTFTAKMEKKTFENLKKLVQEAAAPDGVKTGQIDVYSNSFINAQSHQQGHRAVQAGCFDGRCMIASQNDDYGSWQNSNYGGRIAWFNISTKQYEGEIHIGAEGGHMDGMTYDWDRNMVLKEGDGGRLIQIDNNTKQFANPKYCDVSTGSGSYCYDKARHQLMGISGSTVRFYTYNPSNNTYEVKSTITLQDFELKTGCLQGVGADGLHIYVADSHPDYSDTDYRVWEYDYSGRKTGEYTLGDGFNGQSKEVETVTFDDQNNLWIVEPGGFLKAKPFGNGIKIKYPYVESVTNHWYYHIIDFLGTIGENTPYGAYKKALTAQKVIRYADEDEKLDDCEVELTTLLSSGSGIFYQVCEPYLNEKPSIYLKKIFHGAYYKYDGTTETARKITAARAIESKYGTDDYNDSKFEKNPEAIVNKNITYNWHSSGNSSSKIKVSLEDATEYVKAKKAQVRVLKESNSLIKLDEEAEKLGEDEVKKKLEEITKRNDSVELEFEELGEESPMCKKLVEFKSNKSNTLEAFSILENVNSEAADVNYRLLKKLMIEMNYFTEDEMTTHEKNILLWPANVEGVTGEEVARKINENYGQTSNNAYKTISDTTRDTNDYGIIITNFMEDSKLVAPGDAKVKNIGTDEHGNYIELEFTTLTEDKVYPLQGHMMLLHQDDEKDPKYNIETPFDKQPAYSAAEVMRRYRFKDTYQVFENDDLVGITMRISGLKNIKITAGSTVLRGQEIAGAPKTADEHQELKKTNDATSNDTGDKIYISMKKADKTKVENVEDYISPSYTYEDEKEMAEQLWYLDHPEYGNKYDTRGKNTDYVQWALKEADDPSVGYCQTHRQYDENSNGSKDVDCSSFVYYALKNNGYDVASYTTWPFTTSNEPGILLSLGFTEMDFPGPDSCEEGDILWRDGHTEIYSGDGKSVGAHGADNLPGGHPSGNTGKLATNGDQTGGEVSEVSCSSNWTKIYRPQGGVGGNGGGGSTPSPTGKDVVALLEEWKNQDGGHDMVVKAYNDNAPKYGRSKMSYDDQWCSETASAAYAYLGQANAIGGMAADGFTYENNAKKINIWVTDKKYVPKRGDILITHDPDGARHTAVVISSDGKDIKLIAGGGSKIHYLTKSVGSSEITGYIVPKITQSEISASSNGDTLAIAACRLAYSNYHKDGKVVSNQNGFYGTSIYRQYRDDGKKPHGCCSRGMSTVVNSYLKYDTGLKKTSANSQYHYMAKSSKWKKIGKYKSGMEESKNSILKPGDIVISTHHTCMYVGNEIPGKVYDHYLKGTDGDCGRPGKGCAWVTGSWHRGLSLVICTRGDAHPASGDGVIYRYVG